MLRVGVGPRDQKQIVHQGGGPFGLSQNSFHGFTKFFLGTVAAQGEIRSRMNQCHRRPQFVRRVGGELPNALE